MAAGGVVAALGGVLLGWGLLVEPRLLHTRRICAALPSLPKSWQGQTLALLGDLQIGAPLANTDTVARAVKRAIEARPGAVLLAGDYVYDAAGKVEAVIEQVQRLLRPLPAAEIPTLAVLGNHDFAPESTADTRVQEAIASAVEAALERIGIRVLRNKAFAIAAGEDNWRRAFAHVPSEAPRVVLAHDPLALQGVPCGWAPLALAGHTHGGQIRVPGTRDLGPARWPMPWPEYLDGWIDRLLRRGNRLYVNRGIGFSRLPLRIGAPPELTLITLHAGQLT